MALALLVLACVKPLVEFIPVNRKTLQGPLWDLVVRPLPREPFKGQKRPPCKRYSEVELVGGCWMQHALNAPCPEDLYEYQGKCYVPAFSAKQLPPQSLGQ